MILAGVDSMINILGHEIAETVSDPELNAWLDASGAENAGTLQYVKLTAMCVFLYQTTFLSNNSMSTSIMGFLLDKCNFKFGSISTDSSGFKYNQVSGSGRKFMIQSNWRADLQSCSNGW
jgi:hypothetical protein